MGLGLPFLAAVTHSTLVIRFSVLGTFHRDFSRTGLDSFAPLLLASDESSRLFKQPHHAFPVHLLTCRTKLRLAAFHPGFTRPLLRLCQT